MALNPSNSSSLEHLMLKRLRSPSLHTDTATTCTIIGSTSRQECVARIWKLYCNWLYILRVVFTVHSLSSAVICLHPEHTSNTLLVLDPRPQLPIWCFALFTCFQILYKIWKFCVKFGHLVVRKIFKFVFRLQG